MIGANGNRSGCGYEHSSQFRGNGTTRGPVDYYLDPHGTAPSPRHMRAAMRENSRRTGLLDQPTPATSPGSDKEHA